MIELMGLSAAAVRLGVSVPTLYRLMQSGRLAFYRIGGRRKVSPEDLDAYIRGTRVSAERKA